MVRRYSQILTDGNGKYWVWNDTESSISDKIFQQEVKGVSVRKIGGGVPLPGPGQDAKIIEAQEIRAQEKALEYERLRRQLAKEGIHLPL